MSVALENEKMHNLILFHNAVTKTRDLFLLVYQRFCVIQDSVVKSRIIRDVRWLDRCMNQSIMPSTYI